MIHPNDMSRRLVVFDHDVEGNECIDEICAVYDFLAWNEDDLDAVATVERVLCGEVVVLGQGGRGVRLYRVEDCDAY